MTNHQYPIGQYDPPEVITASQREAWIEELAEMPFMLQAIALRMNDEELKRRYRPGGWTAAQVIHHLADSHINSYVRFKLALTEDNPVIKPYDEALWAELPDGKELDVTGSIALLEQTHLRLVKILRHMKEEDWRRTFHHPESGKDVRLDWNLGMYAWHGRHHLAHIGLVLK